MKNLRKIQATLIVALAGSLILNDAKANDLQLIVNSQSGYRIVVFTRSLNNREAQYLNWAADQMQSFINKSSHVTLPVSTGSSSNNQNNSIEIGKLADVSVDVSDRTKRSLGNDGFIIKTSGTNVVIAGNTLSGTMYGVFDFLEKAWGIKCLTPTDFFIPNKTDVNLAASFNDVEVPSFEYRRLYSRFGTDFPYNWWNKTSDQPYDIPAQFRDVIPDLCKFGYFVHSMDKLLPPDKYFSTHPEYFALVNGQRNKNQPCFTNPDVAKIINSSLDDLIAKNPQYKFWGISANDNGAFCRGNTATDFCGKLFEQEGTDAAALLLLVNNVAKAHPDKNFIMLAYSKTYTPPKTIKPEPNVYVLVADYLADYDRRFPISDQKQPVAVLNGWASLTNNLMYWEYYTNFSNANTPFPNLNTIAPDLQYFANAGIKYMVNQSWSYNNGEMSELRSYLLSHLSWNVNLDYGRLLNEFTSAFYGNAAPYMLRYINQLNANAENIPNGRLKKLYLNYKPEDYRDNFLSPENLKSYKAILNDAAQKVAGDTLRANRVKKELFCVLATEWEVRKSDWEKSNNTDQDAKRDLDDCYPQLMSMYKKYMPESLNVGGQTNKEQYKKSIDDFYNKKVLNH